MKDLKTKYYERVVQIVGTELLEKTIAVHNTPFLCKAVELFASCRILKFVFNSSASDNEFIRLVMGLDLNREIDFNQLLANLLKKDNQFEDSWSFIFQPKNSNPEIIIAGGNLDDCLLAYQEAQTKAVPVVLAVLLQAGISLVSVVFPGQPFPWENLDLVIDDEITSRYYDWIDLNNQVASIAKSILLRGTNWQRQDFEDIFKQNKTTVLLSHPSWPWVNKYLDLNIDQDKQCLKQQLLNAKSVLSSKNIPTKKTVMIIGIGSLGSLVADHFRGQGMNVVGVDGKEISIYNPVRQLYGTDSIGISKALALPKILAEKSSWLNLDEVKNENDRRRIINFGDNFFAGINQEIPDNKIGQQIFTELLNEFNPDLVVLTTAHPVEFRLANVLRQKNIPHIIGRCYRRARWFEITCVDGINGPCFGCLQGHLYKGAPPTLTEEELARYDDSVVETGMVQAEPATRIDTARCADVVARLGEQFLLSKDVQDPWFTRMHTEERNCLIGGNFAEKMENRDWSFGISAPGKSTLYGVINFIGSEAEAIKQCLYCGKKHDVLIHRKTNNYL